MKKLILLAAVCALTAINALAQHEWLHIYRNNQTINTGLAVDVDSISFSKSAVNDTLYESMTIVRNGEKTQIKMADIDSVIVGTNVPTIYIDIENGAEVVVKETYLNAKIRIEGYGAYPDFDEADVTIKGRGNSTWNMSKKPYRLKFKKKQEMLGFRKAKSFALIANFIDCSLMRNPIALKLGQLLGLEFTNTFVPANLVINGKYRGSYMVTEKIGINGGSVDIDETTSVLFELDTNYDEPYKFYSPVFRLPVMVKDPDFSELALEPTATMTASQMFEKWKAEFTSFESTLSTYGQPSSDFVNKMDIESLVDYLMVFSIAGNHEPHHPKSVYLYKTEGGKFKMGPIWDFDWAYTFSLETEGRGDYTNPLLNGSSAGDNFFKAMLRSPEVMELYKKRWAEFKTDIYPRLVEFIDEYAKTIEVTAAQNGELWPAGRYDGKYTLGGSENHRKNVEDLKKWIQNRIDWCDSASNYGLY